MMDKEKSFRTSQTEIGGTVYVVESRECDTAKETAYLKLKRLITTNTKHLEKLSNNSNQYQDINSTSSR
jgi:hypothetical protein